MYREDVTLKLTTRVLLSVEKRSPRDKASRFSRYCPRLWIVWDSEPLGSNEKSNQHASWLAPYATGGCSVRLLLCLEQFLLSDGGQTSCHRLGFGLLSKRRKKVGSKLIHSISFLVPKTAALVLGTETSGSSTCYWIWIPWDARKM